MIFKKLAFWDDIHLKKLELSVKTDDYIITIDDIGKLIILNSTIDKTFTLPSIVESLIGQLFRVATINTGKLTVAAHVGQTINGMDFIYATGKYHVANILINSVVSNHAILFSTEGQISDFWETGSF